MSEKKSDNKIDSLELITYKLDEMKNATTARDLIVDDKFIGVNVKLDKLVDTTSGITTRVNALAEKIMVIEPQNQRNTEFRRDAETALKFWKWIVAGLSGVFTIIFSIVIEIAKAYINK